MNGLCFKSSILNIQITLKLLSNHTPWWKVYIGYYPNSASESPEHYEFNKDIFPYLIVN